MYVLTFQVQVLIVGLYLSVVISFLHCFSFGNVMTQQLQTKTILFLIFTHHWASSRSNFPLFGHIHNCHDHVFLET